jgi:heme exporter protein C
MNPARSFIYILLAIGMPIATWFSFTVKDAQGFLKPEFARVFFWHFPCPIIATVFVFGGAWLSFRHVRSGEARYQVRADVCVQMAMYFILLTMISGIFFSRVQWNEWWHNDPRQVSFGLVVLLYFAYFVMRGQIADQDQRENSSSIYQLSALLPFLFLTFVFPRLPQIVTNHPNDSVMSGQIKGAYALVIVSLMILVGLASWLVYNVLARIAILNHETELLYAERSDMENLGRNAPEPLVVRPTVVDHSGE